jgi:hypothetical protein
VSKPPRLGRPPEFTSRVRLTVFLDASELRLIQAKARAERLSASKWARRRLVAGAPKGDGTMGGKQEGKRRRGGR